MRKRGLTSDEACELQRRREFLECLLASKAPEHHTAAEKLTLLDLLFKRKTFGADHRFQLDAMGVVLGDALCQILDLEWMTVEDDDGAEPAVSFPGAMIFASPLSIVHKRIERNEDVEVFYLFVGLLETLTKQLRSGNYHEA